MKPRIILTVTIVALLVGCGDEKKSAELEQLRAEKAALAKQIAEQQRVLEQEKLRAAQAEAQRVADGNRDEAQRLAAERAALDAERKQIADESERATADQKAVMQAELRKREDALKAAEVKAAAELKAAAEAKRAAAQAAWEMEMEMQRERSQQAIQTSAKRNTDFFYDALDPYGDWDEVEGYGPVFQPREAQRDRNWRPYTDGEWVWSDHGWAWRSNETHGWATSHYGRWVRHAREGWMWVPGSEWAPAWVSWRKSDTHIGWAPLPPEAHSGRGFNASVDEYYDIGARNYNFVPREQFCGGRTYIGHVIPPERNVTIFQATVNVTNISYRQTNAGSVIVNHGPELAFVNARAAKPLQLIKLEREDARDARSSGGPAIVADGMLRLIAPVFAHERPTAAPRVIRKTATREVDRGWAGDDAATQKLIRDRAAAEARQAEEEERDAFHKLVKEAKPLPLPKIAPEPKPPVLEKKPEAPKLLVKPVIRSEKDDEPKKPTVPPKPEKPEANPNSDLKKPFRTPKPDNDEPKPAAPKVPVKPSSDENEKKPSKPVIPKPDVTPEKPAPVQKPKADQKSPDANKPASLLKKKRTDEEKAELKEEAEKALKKLKDKLGE